MLSSEEKSWQFRYWLVSHQIILKRIIFILALILDIFLIGWGIFKLWSYSVDQKNYNQMILTMTKGQIDFQKIRSETQPQEIQVLEVEDVPTKAQKMDLVARISNPNQIWAIKSFDYKFNFDNNLTQTQKSFIGPQEERFLFDFGIDYSQSLPQSINLIIENIEWQRIRDFRTLPISQFEITNLQLSSISVQTPIDKESQVVSRLMGEITNQSIQGFWQVGVATVVYSGSTPVAVNHSYINQFQSREKRTLDITWDRLLPSGARVEVKGEVNLLDEDNFMEIEEGGLEIMEEPEP